MAKSMVAICLAGMTVMGSASKADEMDRIVRDLASSDRPARVAAMERASELPEVPDAVLAKTIEFIQFEVNDAFTARGAREKDGPARSSARVKIPTNREDISIVRLKANPGNYTGEAFTMTAGIRLGDTYPSGSLFPKERYLSLYLNQFAPDGHIQSESFGRAFLERDKGLGLLETILDDVESGATHTLVRLKALIPVGLGRSDQPETSIQIIDFAIYDLKAGQCMPWGYQGIDAAFKALKHSRQRGIDILIGIIARDQAYATPFVDRVVRTMAANTLMDGDFPPGVDAEILPKILKIAGMPPESDSRAIIVDQCERIIARLHSRFQSAEAGKKSQKVADPNLKANTFLAMGRNLEKSGKAKSAVDYYRRIVKDYPSTKAATEARQRLSVLD